MSSVPEEEDQIRSSPLYPECSSAETAPGQNLPNGQENSASSQDWVEHVRVIPEDRVGFELSDTSLRATPRATRTDPGDGLAVCAGADPLTPCPPQRSGTSYSALDLSADDGRIRTGKLAGLSLNRAIFVLSWPILSQSFLEALLGTVDTSIAAHLGDKQTGAIGLASYIMWLVSVIIMSVSIGATALVSRSVGAGHRSQTNRILGQAMTLSLIVGVIVAVVLGCAAPFLGAPMGLDAESSVMMRQYLVPIAVSLPAMVVSTVGFSCLRGAGDSRSPFWIMLIENAVNVPLSVLLSGAHLTYDIGGHHFDYTAPQGMWALGISGIAIGTMAAHYVGAFIVLALMARGDKAMQLHAHRLRPKREPMLQLIRIGLPSLWESLGMWIGNFSIVFIIGRVLTRGGDDGAILIGVHQIAIRLEAFSFLAGFAMGTANATLMGQYLGAGNARMAAKAARRCCVVAACIMGCFSYLFIFHPEIMVRLLSPEPIHLAQVPPLLRLAGYVQIPFAILLVLRQGLRGSGDVKVAMYLTWIGIYGIRVPGAILAALIFPQYGLVAIWTVMVSELVIRALLFLGRFLQGGWKHIKV